MSDTETISTPSAWADTVSAPAISDSDDSQSSAEQTEAVETTADESTPDAPVTHEEEAPATDNADVPAETSEDKGPVPYDRFSEVTAKNRELQEQLAQVEAVKKALAEQGIELEKLPEIVKQNAELASQQAREQQTATIEQTAESAALARFAELHTGTVRNQVEHEVEYGQIDLGQQTVEQVVEARLQELLDSQAGVTEFAGLKSFAAGQLQSNIRAEAQKAEAARTELAQKYEYYNPTVLANVLANGAPIEAVEAAMRDTHEYTAARVQQAIAANESELTRLRALEAGYKDAIAEAELKARNKVIEELAAGRQLVPTEHRSTGSPPPPPINTSVWGRQ